MIVANLFASRLTLLYGPSGVGKSSVLHAGVLPALRSREDVLAVAVREWSGDPVEAIGTALADAAGLAPSRDLAALVGECVAAGRRRVMLLLDQFEHALAARGAEDPLVAGLSSLLRSGLPVSALVAIREESLAELDRFKGRVPGLFDTVVRLEYLDRADGEAAIRGPLAAWASETGTEVGAEDALVEAVLDAVPAGRAVDGIETAQLQLVMERVFEAESTPVLRRSTYEALGGADGIVRRHVNEALDALPAADVEPASISLDRLVTPSGARISFSTGDLAAHARVSEERLRPILERLSAARVLRPVAGDRFEIYHELLADAVLSWLTAHAADVEARRRVRRARIGALLAVVLVAGVAVFGALFFYARTQRAHSQSRKQAAAARRLLAAGVDPQVGLEFAIKAAKESRTREAVLALRAALAEPQEEAQLHTRGAAKSVQFSADGKWLLIAEDEGGVRIWDVASHKPVRTLLAAGTHPVQAVFCPDEQHVAVVDDTGASLVGGRRLADSSTKALACSADGKRIAIATSDGAIVREGRRRLATLDTDPSPAIALSPDGRFVASSLGGGLGVTDLDHPASASRSTEAPRTLEHIASAAFDPTGRTVIAGGTLGSVLTWSVAGSAPPAPFAGHGSYVNSVASSPDGALALSASTDRTARIWAIATGSLLGILRGHDDIVRAASFSPDGRTVATASEDGTVRLWPVPVVAALRPAHDRIDAAALGGRHVVIASSGAVELWDAPRAQRLASVSVPSVSRLAIAPDGSRVAFVDDDGAVHAWKPGEPPRTLTRPRESFLAAAVGPGGRTFALVANGVVRLVDPEGRTLRELRDRTLFTSGAFSPDGKIVAAAAFPSGDVVLFDTGTGRVIRRLRVPGASLDGIGFSPDGTQVIAPTSDGAAIWDVATGALRLRLRGHGAPVQSVAFGDGGRLVATSSTDDETRVWDAATGDLLTIVPGERSAFADDRYLVTVDEKALVEVRECGACGDARALLERARARLKQRLSEDQLESYLGG
jgi:WD40 repeat protein